MIAIALVIAAPAMAAQGLIKGTKSYQAGRSGQPEEMPAAEAANTNTQSAEDVSKIAPAAGDQTPAETTTQNQGKTMREEMRLPRKN